MKKWGTKAMFGDLESMATGVLYFVIVVAVGVVLLGNFLTQPSISGSANATATVNTGINSLQGLVGWTPLVITIGVIAVILGLIFAYFRR